ncbi:MAG: response regulator [Gammaproteobacteria bacterium]|nr:response regulator [Gammaproteobacteria bacterium]
MTIRRRLTYSLIVIVGLFALNLGVYSWADVQRSKSVNALRDAVTKQLMVAQLTNDVEDQQERTSLLAALLGTDDQPNLNTEELEDAITSIEQLRNATIELTSLADSSDRSYVNTVWTTFGDLASRWTAFYAQFSPSAAATPSADASTPPNPASHFTISAPHDEYDALSNALAALNQIEQGAVNSATKAINDVEQVTRRTTLIIFGCSATLALILAFSLIRTVSGGLATLKRGVLRIGQGDLEHRIGHNTRDEMGDLSRAFDQMTDKLESTMKEAQAAQASANEANRAKSTFLANMSHELRTPMNAIIGYTEMLVEDAHDANQPEFVPDLEKVLAASRHLLSLINDVLDLSKIEAGGMTLYIEPFDIEPLVNEVATTVSPLVEQNTNRLTLDVDADIGAMHADQTKLRQTLFNLLSNACKFTQNGTIAVSAKSETTDDGDAIRFCVQDSGIGMTEEQLARVFEPFTQAESSTAHHYGGTGLGLSISKEFCELMGGSIDVSSAPQGGTTFTVRLPREVRPPTSLAREPVVVAGQRGTILVIDDDARVLDLSTRILAKQGFSVATAQAGEQGLAMATQLQPTAILLDIIMPGMDGWQVLTALKADPATAAIPVVMMTMLDDRQTGFALGATEYLTKPIDRQRLTDFFDALAPDTITGDVLVVEDDEATRAGLGRALEARVATVRMADNGRAALALMQQRTPDLIFLDLMMPEMDGFEFLEHLRTNAAWREVAVVVITAKSLSADERARLNGYVDEVVQKSGQSANDIFESVNGLLAQIGKARLSSTLETDS